MGLLTLITVALIALTPLPQAEPVNLTERSLTYEVATVRATISIDTPILYPADPVPITLRVEALADTGRVGIGFSLEHLTSTDPACAPVLDEAAMSRYICSVSGLTAGEVREVHITGVPVGFIYPYAACDNIADYIGVPFRLSLEGRLVVPAQQVVTQYESGYCTYLPEITL